MTVADKVDLDLASRLIEKKLVPLLLKLSIDLTTVSHLLDAPKIKSNL